MSELEFEVGLETRTVAPPARAIRAAAAESLSAATAGPIREYFRSFGSHSRNSRVSHTLPKGSLALRWRAETDPDFPPSHVLEARDRILVQAGEWQLLDRAGKTLARGRASGAPMFTDSPGGLFYAIDSDAYFTGYRLSDGEPAFKVLPSQGDSFTRVHLARNGSRTLFVGAERALDPHGARKPQRSLIEVRDLGAKIEADDLGFLSSGGPIGLLRVPSPTIVAASSADLIAAARPNVLYIIKWDLAVEAAIEGTFDPRAVSLDEAGRIYLIVEAAKRISLWLLKRTGERLYAFDLPDGVNSVRSPAIVAHDHTAYVLAGQQIFSIGADGKQRWSKTAAGPIGGAVVTADDVLVVAEGGDIARYDAKGERQVVHAVSGETFVTPPLVTGAGELLVASKTTIYCFGAAR